MLSLQEIGLTADDIRSWFERTLQPKNVRIDGYQCYCSCPVPGHNHKHGDKNPSFSFNCEQGVWTCHSTGDSGNIKDLCEKCGAQAPWGGSKAPQRQTIYVYEDTTGKPVYEVVRLDDVNGKKIFQRAILPDGTKKNSMKGIERIPYRLPEILEAQKANQPIFIVEGEKCVEALRGLGLVATTNSGGAGKWGDCGKYFQKGINVIIIPDSDVPGRKHGLEVATDLKQRGCNVKVLNLPNLQQKEDIYDWLKKGHSKEELLKIVEDMQEWDLEQVEVEDEQEPENERGFKFVWANDLEIKEPRFLVKNLLEEDCLGLVIGDPSSGKSLFVLDMACCISTGAPFHGRQVKEGPVLYLAGEGHNGLRRRLAAWERENKISLKDARLAISTKAAALTDGMAVEEVIRAIEEILTPIEEKPALLIVDTLARNFGIGDENSAQDMGIFIAELDRIRTTYECSVLVVHHSGVADKNRGRGSTALRGAVDAEYKVEKEGTHHVVTCQKAKDMVEPEPIHFERQSVEILETIEGDIITAPVLIDAEPQEKKTNLTNNEQIGITSFLAAAKEKGRVDGVGRFQGVHIEDWRPYFYEKSTADKTDTKRKAFDRAREGLVRKKELSVESDFYKYIGKESELIENDIVKKIKKIETRTDTDIRRTCPDVSGPKADRQPDGHGQGSIGPLSCPDVRPLGEPKKGIFTEKGVKTFSPPIQPKQKSVGNLLEIFPDGFKSRKVSSLDKFLSAIQEKKGDVSVEISNQPKMTEQPEQVKKPDHQPIPKSPPEDWAAWLESSEPAVKEKYDEVFNRLKVFLSDEMAKEKARLRAWDLQQKLKDKAA